MVPEKLNALSVQVLVEPLGRLWWRWQIAETFQAWIKKGAKFFFFGRNISIFVHHQHFFKVFKTIFGFKSEELFGPFQSYQLSQTDATYPFFEFSGVATAQPELTGEEWFNTGVGFCTKSSRSKSKNFLTVPRWNCQLLVVWRCTQKCKMLVASTFKLA